MNEEDRYTRITLRIPRELHARLDIEADNTSKSLNAEIIARLQASFSQQNDVGTEALHAELEQHRALAKQFQVIADMCDHFRSVATRMLMLAVERLTPAAKRATIHPMVEEDFLEWLNERDSRGAVFSILSLIDNADSEVVKSMRHLADHFEELDLHRKPLVLTRASGSKKPVRAQALNKVINIGNIGMDPQVQYLEPKPPPNKGPVKRTRGKPQK